MVPYVPTSMEWRAAHLPYVAKHESGKQKARGMELPRAAECQGCLPQALGSAKPQGRLKAEET